MNISQFFSYVNSFCFHHKGIIGGQKEKNLCGNECQAGFHKLSHSIKMKDMLKKYTPPQGNINAYSIKNLAAFTLAFLIS